MLPRPFPLPRDRETASIGRLAASAGRVAGNQPVNKAAAAPTESDRRPNQSRAVSPEPEEGQGGAVDLCAGSPPAAGVDLGGLQSRLGYVLRQAQLWIFQDFIRAMAEHDIRPGQFSVLTVIGANPGIAQRDVSRALGIERARLVLVLDELERRGLAERAPSPTDRRSRTLSLTEEGKRLLRHLTALADEHEARVVDRVGVDGKAELLRMLAGFRDR
jgi:DNA-binding MarR family transcriptional regulator